jgi:hypothetical protein
MKTLLLASTAAAALVMTACANDIAASDTALGAGVPVPALECPSEPVMAGTPFVVDGSHSGDPSKFSSISLQIGDDVATELTHEFVVDAAGPALATLTVTTNKKQDTATASCRVMITPVPPAGGYDISGTFALVAYDMPYLTGSILDPNVQCALAPQVSLVHLGLDGSNVTMDMQSCDISLAPVNVLFVGRQTTEVLFNDHVPKIGPFTFPIDGAKFAPPLDLIGEPMIDGVSLETPDAPLPHDLVDGLLDSDGDGPLGVHIRVNDFWDLNIVYRRIVRAMSGTVVSANEIDGLDEGSYQADSEAALLNGLLDNFAKPSGHGMPSTFKMLRVAEGASCADLREQKAQLVSQLPAPVAPPDCGGGYQDAP